MPLSTVSMYEMRDYKYIIYIICASHDVVVTYWVCLSEVVG
jgi:hypothetical protein